MAKAESDFDVIVIGGGPAGLSASLWCSDLGLNTLLIEKEDQCGGQLLRVFNFVENYIGIRPATGVEIRDRFISSLKQRPLLMMTNSEVKEIDVAAKSVTLASGKSFTARSMIAAMGVRRRRLCVGEERYFGKGLIASGSNYKEKGKRIAIVGGGDAAIENSLILGKAAKQIFLIHRGSNFRARIEFTEKMKDEPKIEVRLNSIVRGFVGNEWIEGIEVENVLTGLINTIGVDAVLVRIGIEPNTELLQGKVELDEQGYVIVSNNCQTSAEGIYSAGDAANPVSPTISTAAGTGASAAKAIHKFLYGERR